MDELMIDTAGLVVAAIGLVGTAIGLWLVYRQIAQTSHIALGDLLMNIDQILMEYHNDVHVRLRPGGAWDDSTNPGSGPQVPEEWAEVETYMGLFERIYALMNRGIIPEYLVQRFYSYRIRNIVANETICVEKLVKQGSDWQDFLALCTTLDIAIDCRQVNRN